MSQLKLRRFKTSGARASGFADSKLRLDHSGAGGAASIVNRESLSAHGLCGAVVTGRATSRTWLTCSNCRFSFWYISAAKLATADVSRASGIFGFGLRIRAR